MFVLRNLGPRALFLPHPLFRCFDAANIDFASGEFCGEADVLALLADSEGELIAGHDGFCAPFAVERTLTRPAHFARFLGQRVTAKLYTPVNGVRIYEGSLVSRDDNGDVTLDLGDSTVTLPKKSISKIDTWYDWANDKPERSDPRANAETEPEA